MLFAVTIVDVRLYGEGLLAAPLSPATKGQKAILDSVLVFVGYESWRAHVPFFYVLLYLFCVCVVRVFFREIFKS